MPSENNNIRLVLEAVNRTNENFDQVLSLMRQVVAMSQTITAANSSIAQSTANLADQNTKLAATYGKVRTQQNGIAQSAAAHQRILSSQNAIQKQTAASTESMVFSFGRLRSLLLTLGVIEATKQLIEANIQIQKITNSLEAVAGKGPSTTSEFAFLRAEADRLGLSLPVIAQEYTKILAAGKPLGFSTEQIRDIFISVTEASVVLGLSMDDVHGTLRAVQQMMSKGTVQAEELRGQLGERLPGAVSLLAKGLGVTTAELGKMLETGKVLSKDALPALARSLKETYGGQVAEATHSTAREIDRLGNALFNLKNTFNDSGFITVFVGAVKGLATYLALANDGLQGLTKGPGQAMEKQAVDLAAAARSNIQTLAEFNALRNQIVTILESAKNARAQGDFTFVSNRTYIDLFNALQNMNAQSALLNEKELARRNTIAEQTNLYKQQLDAADKIVKKFDEINNRYRAAVYSVLPALANKELTDSLVSKKAEIATQTGRTSAAGDAFNAEKDPNRKSELLRIFQAELGKELQLRTETLEIEKKIAQISSQISAETRQQVNDIKEKTNQEKSERDSAASEAKRKAREAQTKIENDQKIAILTKQAEAEDRINSLRDIRARLEANQNVFELDRQKIRVQLLNAERQATDALIASKKADLGNVIARPVNEESDQLQKTQAIIQLKRDLNQLERERTQILIEQNQQQTALNDVIQTSLISWVNQLGNTATQVANILTTTLSSAIQTVSGNIADAVVGTQTWAQAWDNIIISIVRGLVQTVIQFGLQQAAMFAIRTIYGKASLAAAAVEATAAAAIWAPAATAASIATFGGAAGVGLAAFVSSLLIGQGVAGGLAAAAGSAGGGFKVGGYTGDGNPNEEAGKVHKREFVWPADVVDRVGPAALYNMMQRVRDGGSLGGVGSASTGSAFEPTGPIVPNVSVSSAPAKVVVLNDRRQLEDYLRSPDGRDVILHHVGSHGHMVGIRS